MLVKVRHGVVRWLEPRTDDRPGHVVRKGFRGMTVDIPDDQAQVRLEQGAVVHVDEDLTTVGYMMPLPKNGSDEELKAWVSVATNSEIDTVCEQNPALADRIRNARAEYDKEIEAQNELLGGAKRENTTSDPSDNGGSESQGTGESPSADGGTADGEDEEDEDFTDEDLDDVVGGTVSDVSEFLSEYPEMAQRILDAETRRATQDNNDVRKGVEEAAKVAAAHTAQ